jgi:hypothetical protein
LINHQVTELSRSATLAAIDLPVDDNSHSNTAANGYHHIVIRMHTVIKPFFTERQGIHVIVQENGDFQPHIQEVTKWDILPSKKGALSQDAIHRIDHASQADAHPEQPFLGNFVVLHQIFDQQHKLVNHRGQFGIAQFNVRFFNDRCIEVSKRCNRLRLHQLDANDKTTARI